jgi:hypothetical protein
MQTVDALPFFRMVNPMQQAPVDADLAGADGEDYDALTEGGSEGMQPHFSGRLG